MYAEKNWLGHKMTSSKAHYGTYGARKMALQLRVHIVLVEGKLNSIPSIQAGVGRGSELPVTLSPGSDAFVKCRHLHSGAQTCTQTHT